MRVLRINSSTFLFILIAAFFGGVEVYSRSTTSTAGASNGLEEELPLKFRSEHARSSESDGQTQPLIQSESIGALHRRSYFYIGGAYSPSGNDSTQSSSVFSGQVYVEHLVPQTVKRKYPIVMIHGNGLCWCFCMFETWWTDCLSFIFSRHDWDQFSQYT